MTVNLFYLFLESFLTNIPCGQTICAWSSCGVEASAKERSGAESNGDRWENGSSDSRGGGDNI